MDHQQHAQHVEWVCAAMRDHLHLAERGGAALVDENELRELAEVARKATLNWAVSAALNNQIPHTCGPDCDHD